MFLSPLPSASFFSSLFLPRFAVSSIHPCVVLLVCSLCLAFLYLSVFLLSSAECFSFLLLLSCFFFLPSRDCQVMTFLIATFGKGTMQGALLLEESDDCTFLCPSSSLLSNILVCLLSSASNSIVVVCLFLCSSRLFFFLFALASQSGLQEKFF